MPSPFLGMDPYLEGYLWSDVHQALAAEIRKQLIPHIRPRYVARLAIQTIQDETATTQIGIMYPDVEILANRTQSTEIPSTMPTVSSSGVAIAADAPNLITDALTIPLLNFETKLITIEVYDRAQNQLVTSIELLSPVNKYKSGLTQYNQKQYRLRAAGVHLIEIDLLRAGQKPILSSMPEVQASKLEQAHYLVTLIRAGATDLQAWPIHVRDSLPTIPVPLLDPDPDVPINLSTILATVYDDAAYDLSIDYSQTPPPPKFDDETLRWIQRQIQQTSNGYRR